MRSVNILDGVFLPNQHNTKTPRKLQHIVDELSQRNVPRDVINWMRQCEHLALYQTKEGRLFYANKRVSMDRAPRPLNTQTNEKKAFYSILNLAPASNTNTNTASSTQNNHSINHANVELNATSLLDLSNGNKANTARDDGKQYELQSEMTANKQYKILMNNQYCNILAFLILSNTECPLYINNAFRTTLKPEKIHLSAGAKQIMYEENAGGQSELSEGFSFELLQQAFGAKLLKTEMAIRYWWNSWKKTDFSVSLHGITIGVSVTRAMCYNGLFTKQAALRLLTKKLNGINESTQGVLECDEWQRQILHIWATDKYIEELLYATFLQLLFEQPQLVNDTVIMVTVASQDMWWLFYQDKYFKKEAKNKKTKKKVVKKKLAESIQTQSDSRLVFVSEINRNTVSAVT